MKTLDISSDILLQKKYYSSADGTIFLDETQRYPCKIHFSMKEICTDEKASVRVLLKNKMRLLTDVSHFPWTFEGKANANTRVIVTNMALSGYSCGSRQGYSVYEHRFQFGEFEIGEKRAFDELEFFLPNFTISFDEMEQSGDFRFRNKTILTIPIGNERFAVTLRGIGAPRKKNRKRATLGEDSSGVMVIIKKLSGALSIDEGKQVVEGICHLSTLAYGGEVAWRCLFANRQENAFLQVRDVRIPQSKPMRRIVEVNLPRELSNFLNACVPGYYSLAESERKSMMKFVAGLQFSGQRLSFPAPILLLGSAIEDFVDSELDDLAVHYVEKSEREKAKPSFEKFIKETVFPIVAVDDQIDFNDEGTNQKLAALLQRTFRSRISVLLQKKNVPFDPEVVGQFVRLRNKAAHGGYKLKKGHFSIWSKVAALMELLILKKVNYKGKFIDWSTSPASDAVL